MKITYYFIIILIFSNPIITLSQNIIKGRVIDLKSQQGIENVNIYINDQKNGTASSKDGYFILNVDSSNDMSTISIKHVAFKSKTIVLSELKKNTLIELEENFFQMNEIVVTGTRSNKIKNNAPIYTELISKKQITDSGELNVAEFLSNFSGINIESGVDNSSNINLNGIDSKYILILLDGQTIIGKFNNRVSLDQIPTKNLEKIEIIKGPGSSLYGSEAMGGVINLITDKKFSNTFFGYSLGYNDSEKKIISNGLNNGSGFININIQNKISNLTSNFNFNTDLIKIDNDLMLEDKDKIYKNSGTLILKYEFNKKNEISLSSNVFKQQEIGETILMKTESQILRYNFNLEHNYSFKKKWFLKQNIIRQNYERSFNQDRPWGEKVKDDLTTDNNIEYNFMFSKKNQNNEINFGFETSKAIYASNRLENNLQQIYQNSIFGQLEKNFNNNFKIIYGNRIDSYYDYKNVLSPRLGLFIPIRENLRFRASWGKGFRAPSFIERFINWYHVQVGYTVLGNPELKPEISSGSSFEFEYYKSLNYEFGLRIYQTIFHNLIQSYSIDSGLFTYVNISKANFNGVEVRGKFNSNKNILVSWGLNFVDNKNEKNELIPNTNPMSGNLNFSFNAKKNIYGFNIKWIGKYIPYKYDISEQSFLKSENKLPNQFLIKINYKYLINENLKISFGIRNLFDYTNNTYGPYIGRKYYTEISNNF